MRIRLAWIVLAAVRSLVLPATAAIPPAAEGSWRSVRYTNATALP